jgi:sugar lactone lactonase YvrE
MTSEEQLTLIDAEFELLDHLPLLLGEGPAWDAETSTLSLVDIDGRGFLTSTPDGTTRAPTSDMIGCAVPWASGVWLAAVGTDLIALRPDGASAAYASLPDDPSTHRANDGKCDPAGRLWVGVMARDAARGAGSLYVVHADGLIQRALGGMTIPNGLGWSPDGATMYVTDTGSGTITAYDFDVEAATISAPRVLTTFEASEGGPDGLCVDAEGQVWTALWDGGGVARIAPDGARTGMLRLPVTRTTSCCFAGPELTELVVTSAHIGLDAQTLRSHPLSGATFKVRAGVAGLPAARFAGTVPSL